MTNTEKTENCFEYGAPSKTKTFSGQHSCDEKIKISSQKIAPLFSPLPQIPDDLRSEAFSSEAIARFHIAADGLVVEVEMIKPAANPRLNHLLLRSLKNWKFAPTSAAFTQEIHVRFSVQ
jgi:protein TonB